MIKGEGCQKHQINLAFGNPQIIIRYGRRKLFVLEREIIFPDPVSFSFDDHLFGIDKIERTKTTLFCWVFSAARVWHTFFSSRVCTVLEFKSSMKLILSKAYVLRFAVEVIWLCLKNQLYSALWSCKPTNLDISIFFLLAQPNIKSLSTYIVDRAR